MPSTKKEISDTVLYRLAGGVPDSGFPVDERDIWSSLEDIINATFKVHHFDTTLPSGDTIPENTMIATYENIAVTSSGERAYSTLPITPISLPRNMGIYMVYDPKYPDMPYIPVQRGQMALLKADRLLNDLMGQAGYEPLSNKIIYSKDITTFGTTSVTMELCVFDISQYTATQDLPIPADMVGSITDQLVLEFSKITAEAGVVNNFTNAGQTEPQK